MDKKEQPANVNNNVNNNNVNVNVHIPEKKRIYTKREKKSNWVTKLIVGELITIIVSVAVYYMTGGKTGKQGVIENGSPAIQPNK